MNRFIDADELTEFYEPYKDMEVPVNALLEQIKDTPTADVVEVIRCKECKHCRDCILATDADGNVTDTYKVCNHWRRATFDNGYCSYGKRKESEDE